MIRRLVFLALVLMLAQVAQFTFASMYDKSVGRIIRQGAPADYAEAVNWYREAEDQGEAKGLYRLGLKYHHGHGVTRNYSEAAKWYRLAGEQGYGMGLLGLGIIYLNGLGVPQNYVQGHMWLNLAAAAGDDYARNVRDDMAKLMTPAQRAEAHRRTREWVANHKTAACWFNNGGSCPEDS